MRLSFWRSQGSRFSARRSLGRVSNRGRWKSEKIGYSARFEQNLGALMDERPLENVFFPWGIDVGCYYHLDEQVIFRPALLTDTFPIAFLDTNIPRDPLQALRVWNKYDPAAELDLSTVRTPFLSLCSLGSYLDVDMEELERLHREDQQENIICSVPTIELKIAVKEELKQQLQDAERLCQQRVDVELRRRYAQLE